MKLSTNISLLFLLAIGFIFSSCDEQNRFQIDYSLALEKIYGVDDLADSRLIEREIGDHTLKIYVVEEGSGEFTVERRDAVSLYYVGVRHEGEFDYVEDDIFDSSYRNGNETPANFSSLENLIQGFREGLIGMKEGEKRVLIIPPALGYGGSSSSNLRNDTLRFDIELEAILY